MHKLQCTFFFFFLNHPPKSTFYMMLDLLFFFAIENEVCHFGTDRKEMILFFFFPWYCTYFLFCPVSNARLSLMPKEQTSSTWLSATRRSSRHESEWNEDERRPKPSHYCCTSSCFFFFFCPANIGRQFTVFTSGQQNNNNKINVVLVAAESEEIIHSARDFVHTHAGHENTPFAVPWLRKGVEKKFKKTKSQ